VTVYSFLFLPPVFGVAARDGLFIYFIFFFVARVRHLPLVFGNFLLDVFFNAARVRLFTHVIYLFLYSCRS